MKKTIILCITYLLTLHSFCITAKTEIESMHSNPIIFDSYDLVIISPKCYSDEIQPLIEHKNNHNIKTFLKITEEIYDEYQGRDEAEQIKYFIKDAREEYRINFVLIIGRADMVPTRYTHIYYSGDFEYPTPTHWVFASDFYYADIYDENGSFSSWDNNGNGVYAEYAWDGNYDTLDFKHDVYVGRLPCNNEQEVNSCVQKIRTYETTQAWSQQWFTNIVCIAGDSLPGDEENIDEGEYVQRQVINIMQGFIPEKIWASLDKLHSPLNINEAINNGAGFVFFNGHGLHDSWATHPHNSNSWIPPGLYSLDDINVLTNGEKLPIIISDACYHCQYDMYNDCFAWSFVRNPQGGAIAFIGGSDTDLGYPGTAIIQKGIERLCLEISHMYMKGCSFLGFLIGDAIDKYTDGEMDEVDIITVLQNHLFGDPTLRISGTSRSPLTPEPPCGATSGKINTDYSYVVETVDPEGDDVYYLFDWGDSTASEWIGSFDSGAPCNVTHRWETQGSFQIRVRAKDVHGLQSEWSNPLEVSMSKFKPHLPSLEDRYTILFDMLSLSFSKIF